MDIKNKVVLITGATGGIGRQLSVDFAKKGAQLILISRTKEKLENLITVLEGNNHVNFAFDFTQTDDLDNLVADIGASTSKIDVMINAAGVGVYKPLEEVSIDEWEESMSINVNSPFFLSKMLLPLLKNSERSVVINIGSGMGKIPTACRSVYCATKFALRGLTMSLAEEFDKTNIKFIHIALGSTLTEFGPLSLEDKMKENLEGKAYLTPEGVSHQFIKILENEELAKEIEIYPTDYTK